MDVREKLIELLTNSPQLDVLDWATGWEEAANYLIAHGVTVQEWISVTERLPEQPPNRVDEQGRSWSTQDIDCIVYDGKIVFAAHYSFQNKFFWYSDTLHPLKNITHWMPMPEPPEDDA